MSNSVVSNHVIFLIAVYKIKIIRLRKKKGTKENIKLVKIQFLRKRQFLL
jgi:hypothetical protein